VTSDKKQKLRIVAICRFHFCKKCDILTWYGVDNAFLSMKFLSNLFGGSSSYLGVDIGTTSIKIVELEKSGSRSRLVNYGILESYGHFERPNSVIQANALKISEKEAIAILSLLLKRVHFRTRNAIASIPSFASFLTMVEMPEMSEEETKRAMTFQIKQSIPLPLSEIAVDWMRVGQRDDESGFSKQQILIIALPNETIARYKAICKGAGLSLKALEVENIAFARSVVGADVTPTAVVDLGARSTNISIIDQAFLKHNTQIDYAGDSLTQSIVKGLGISYRRAEDLKKQRGIAGGTGEYELSTLQTPFLDVILQEIRRTIRDFEQRGGVSIQRVLLVGGGANLIGLESYVEQQVGVPVALGNSLLYVDAPERLNVVSKEIQTRFATAIGLAIKNFT